MQIGRPSLLTTVAAGLAGAALLYTVYFDRKRRSAPDYKQKIREKRKLKEKAKSRLNFGEFPDPRDRHATQEFILAQITLGEELMTLGLLESGAEKLSNAVIVSDQPNQILKLLQQTMPAQAFAAVVDALPGAKARLDATMEELVVPYIKTQPAFVDEELE